MLNENISWLLEDQKLMKELRGFSPLVNYTDRAIAAGQRR
jgi:hypothetical protein